MSTEPARGGAGPGRSRPGWRSERAEPGRHLRPVKEPLSTQVWLIPVSGRRAVPRLPRMTHRPGGPARNTGRAPGSARGTGSGRRMGSGHRSRPVREQSAPGFRWLAGWRASTVAAASAGAVVVLVALAVGISQATAAPACASVITAGGGAAAVTAAGGQTSGEATHYELASGGMGNCSYPSPPAGQLYVALPPPEYGAAAACGSYL